MPINPAQTIQGSDSLSVGRVKINNNFSSIINYFNSYETTITPSLTLASTAVQPSIAIFAGTGLSGGGTLASSRTVSLSSGSLASLSLADSSVQPTRGIFTQHSLQNGGNLSADRTLSLVGDTATPGNNKVYGTNASGVRGWYDAAVGGGSGDVPSGRLITAGNGLTGGGDLSADRTINLGTPTTITTATTNSTTSTSHTHAITISAADISAAPTTRLISAGVGMSGGGSLAADRTLTLGTPSTLTGATTNNVTGTTHTHQVTLTATDVGAAPTTRSISTGTGLTGGGNLTADRTISLNSASIASLAKADTAYQPGATVTANLNLGGNRITNLADPINPGDAVSKSFLEGSGLIGQDGVDGENGVGIPTGGTANQVLTKTSSEDFETAWVTPAASVLTAIGGGNGFVSAFGTVNLDIATARVFQLTMTENITQINFNNIPNGLQQAAYWTVILRINSIGNYTLSPGTTVVNWRGGYDWADLNKSANAENIVDFWRVGSETYAYIVDNGGTEYDPLVFSFGGDGSQYYAAASNETLDLTAVTYRAPDGGVASGGLQYFRNTTSVSGSTALTANQVLTVTRSGSSGAASVSIPRRLT
jgi:hypothetical protein